MMVSNHVRTLMFCMLYFTYIVAIGRIDGASQLISCDELI